MRSLSTPYLSYLYIIPAVPDTEYLEGAQQMEVCGLKHVCALYFPQDSCYPCLPLGDYACISSNPNRCVQSHFQFYFLKETTSLSPLYLHQKATNIHSDSVEGEKPR